MGVRSAIDRYKLAEPGAGIVVGVSGGPDSIALLHALHALESELDFSIVVAHLDHGLRRESVEEADFVRNISDRLKKRFELRRIDVGKLAARKSVSLEEAGRRERYDFFEEIRGLTNANRIATAHHSDDSIETFLLRLFRGSSTRGLAGIPPQRGEIIRPLIDMSRDEILAFVRRHDIPYCLDRSNFAQDTDRNYVRNAIIPAIMERFPHFKAPMLRTMEQVRVDREFLADLTDDLRDRACAYSDEGVSLSVPIVAAAAEQLASRIVLDALYEVSGPFVRWTGAHVSAALDVIRGSNPSATLDLPGDLRLIRQYDKVRITPKDPDHGLPDFRIAVEGPGIVRIEQVGWEFEFEVIERGGRDPMVSMDPRRAVFDLHEIDFPLTVRPVQPGDRIQPWGMSGSKKIKSLLIDAKIPRPLRKSLPILLKGDDVLWVPGVRRSRHAPVTREAKLVLSVRAVPPYAKESES